MKKTIKTLALCIMLITSGCASGGDKPQNTATAATVEAETTRPSDSPSSSTKTVAQDFDPATNKVVALGDYTIEIPSKWDDKAPNYYAESGGKAAMLFISSTDVEFQMNDKYIEENCESLIKGYMSSLGEYDLRSVKTTSVNNILMDCGVAKSEINDLGVFVEVYLFANPSNGALNCISYMESDNTDYTYRKDLGLIVSSVKLNSAEEEIPDSAIIDQNEIVEEQKESVEEVSTPTPIPEETVDSSDATPTPIIEEKPTTLPDILTIENNEDFAELANATVFDADKQDAFYEKYHDKTIEFDCIVYTLADNPDVKDTFDYVFVIENSSGEAGMMLFCLNRANFLNFRWDRETRPEYLTVGSRLRMRARMTRGDDPTFIYLVPEKSWGK